MQVLAVGPWNRHEFSLVRHQIDPMSTWSACQTLSQATDLLEQQTIAPELLLLAQPRPGCYAQSMLDDLQRLAPLTRIVMVAGNWCEGELRTGQPTRGVLRIYWYDLAAWWWKAMACRTAGTCPPWSEPLDDGYAQRLRTNRSPHAGPRKRENGLVEVDTLQYESFAALADALTSAGWSAVWQRRSRPVAATAGAAAGIWDGGQLDPRENDQLMNFCQSIRKNTDRPIPVIALLDFPRPEHLAMARAAGVQAVLPKPYRIDDLLAELES